MLVRDGAARVLTYRSHWKSMALRSTKKIWRPYRQSVPLNIHLSSSHSEGEVLMGRATLCASVRSASSSTPERSIFHRWLPSTEIEKHCGQTSLKMLPTKLSNCGAST